MIATALAGYFATKFWGADWTYKLVEYTPGAEFPQFTKTAGKVFTDDGLPSLLSHKIQTVALIVFIFLLLDIFDTIGTLVGLGQRAGLMQNGKLPRAQQALLADAFGTLAGTIMGTSTVTSYVESSAGIAAGARTGLAAVVTGILMLASIFAYPFVEVFGSAIPVAASELSLIPAPGGTVDCYPIIAPVLIIIGCYMISVVRHIDWDDFSEALPAFLTIIIMQCSMCITDGIIWGFVSYAALKLFSGKPHKCPIVVYCCAILFVAYYIFGR
jgi:AGZA family xanthine/uracil permease-like MFS transporter